jgi:hypothetical protein
VVQVFFDTDVVVAASEQSHPHYAQAWPALRWVAMGRDKGFISAHSIAEPDRTNETATEREQSAADRSDNR